jgi:hypothetical protein
MSDVEIAEAKATLSEAKSEPTLFQKFKKMVDDKKEQYEREKTLKKKRMEVLAERQKDTIKDILHHSVEAGVNPLDEEPEDLMTSVETDDGVDALSLSSSSVEDPFKEKKTTLMSIFSKGVGEDGKPLPWGDHVKQRLKQELNKMSRSLENSGEVNEPASVRLSDLVKKFSGDSHHGSTEKISKLSESTGSIEKIAADQPRELVAPNDEVEKVAATFEMKSSSVPDNLSSLAGEFGAASTHQRVF